MQYECCKFWRAKMVNDHSILWSFFSVSLILSSFLFTGTGISPWINSSTSLFSFCFCQLTFTSRVDTLFPSYPDLINFERQSVFLKWTSRADSAVLVMWMRQRRLLSCWDLKQFRSAYKLYFQMSWAKLQNSYLDILALYSSHSSSTNYKCCSLKAAANDSFGVSVCDVCAIWAPTLIKWG